MASCPECGFPLAEFTPATDLEIIYGCVYDEADSDRATAWIDEAVGHIAGRLESTASAELRDPSAGGWSALEYACHVRDVLAFQRERCLRALRGFGHEPLFMGRDERSIHDSYQTQDPLDVATQLRQWSKLLTDLLHRLGPDEWSATVAYSFPNPITPSIHWVAVHTAHEARHHQWDIERRLG